MKEAIVYKGPVVKIVDSPVPQPGKDQVLTKIKFSGSNPKDWKVAEYDDANKGINSGDDFAGIVEAVGEGVYEFKKGDRVAAFHEMGAPGGSFAEYAINKTTFEAGAAIPLAALTAVVGLFDRLRLPQPWTPIADGVKTPLLVYGGGSSVGSYVLQFASKSNIHPLIVVAGRSATHVRQFLDPSKGDTIIDYREGDEAAQKAVKNMLHGERLLHAFDVIGDGSSFTNVAAVLDPQGAATFVQPYDSIKSLLPTADLTRTYVGDVHSTLKDLGFVYSQWISRSLDQGWFKPQPQQVVAGGLGGVEWALKQLQDGKASAIKYVFDLEDKSADEE